MGIVIPSKTTEVTEELKKLKRIIIYKANKRILLDRDSLFSNNHPLLLNKERLLFSRGGLLGDKPYREEIIVSDNLKSQLSQLK